MRSALLIVGRFLLGLRHATECLADAVGFE
jgi:hypothetical protein